MAKLRFWVNDNLICILRNIKDILLNYKVIRQQEQTTALTWILKFSTNLSKSIGGKKGQFNISQAKIQIEI